MPRELGKDRKPLSNKHKHQHKKSRKQTINHEIMITEEKIHAYKANEARRLQIITFEEELQWADREPPTPRIYPQIKQSKKEIIINTATIIWEQINIKQFLP